MRAAPLALALPFMVACSDDPVEDPPAEHETSTPARTFPGFRDVTADWGVDFVHDAGLTPEKHLPETMGAGAALVDVDADGDLDLYLVQGGALPISGARRTPKPNRLYLNEGDGHMRDATAASGDAAHEGYGMGVVAGDANGDGHVDLFVTNFGPDALLLGDGAGTFRDATRAAGVGDERWTTGATLFDADADGDLDLYVAAYVSVDLADPAWCGRREEGWRTVCHPDQYEGMQDRFYRNGGDGTFTDATDDAGLSDSHGKGLGVVASDFDADGFPDLYVANDSVENRMWRNAGDGTFEDATLLSGTGVDGFGQTEAGMGVATGDVDGDGRLDLHVTNFDHESHTLYHNDGDWLFADATAAARIDAPTRLPVGFGTLLADLDCDGDLDLTIANGHIVDLIHLYHDGQTHAQHAQLFLNDGTGRFADASASSGDLCREPRVGRSLVCGDLDGDGDLDLVATECGGGARLFRNELTNADAATLRGLPRGTRVDLELDDGKRLVRESGPQPSYLGQTAPEVHVGLGGARIEAVSIRLIGGELRGVALEAPLGAGTHRFERSPSGWRID